MVANLHDAHNVFYFTSLSDNRISDKITASRLPLY